MIDYLNPDNIGGSKQTTAPTYGRNASGYGRKIPTSWLLHVSGRWRRVYVVCYSNAGSAYIVVRGERYFLGGIEPRDYLPGVTRGLP
jgi:hypothetical protein